MQFLFLNKQYQHTLHFQSPTSLPVSTLITSAPQLFQTILKYYMYLTNPQQQQFKLKDVVRFLKQAEIFRIDIEENSTIVGRIEKKELVKMVVGFSQQAAKATLNAFIRTVKSIK